MNERIRYALVMLGHLPPRDDDEREVAAIFAEANEMTPRHPYQRSKEAHDEYVAYMRQYQRDHPRTWQQQARDTELRNERRANARFMRDFEKWQGLFKTLPKT